MTGKGVDLGPLLVSVKESLSLIEAQAPASLRQTIQDIKAPPLPSLLEQCRALLEEAPVEEPLELRSLHHFSCTGGTLISKVLAGLPNTHVLSEIDPLSQIGLHHKTPASFAPRDLLLQMLYSYPQAPDELVLDIFLTTLKRMAERLGKQGQRIVLRDHAHSHFCWGPDIPKRPSVYEIVRRILPVHAIVTVRHPLDSYLSLQRNGWVHFEPGTLEEYARRYMTFLDSYQNVEIFRYEDFVEAPEELLQQMSACLKLPYRPEALSLINTFRISGDSGRRGRRIETRPRRPVPEKIAIDAENSEVYQTLLERLAYK